MGWGGFYFSGTPDYLFEILDGNGGNENPLPGQMSRFFDREQAVKSVRHVPDTWRQNQIAVTRWNFNNLQFTTDALPHPKRIRPARIGDGCMKKGYFARVRLWAICGHGDPQSQNDLSVGAAID